MLKSDRFSCSQKIRLKRDPPVLYDFITFYNNLQMVQFSYKRSPDLTYIFLSTCLGHFLLSRYAQVLSKFRFKSFKFPNEGNKNLVTT